MLLSFFQRAEKLLKPNTSHFCLMFRTFFNTSTHYQQTGCIKSSSPSVSRHHTLPGDPCVVLSDKPAQEIVCKKKKITIFFFFPFNTRERGFWMERWFFMQSWDATPSRQWEMASPNNTELYNGSDRRAIKQSGSQAFQISLLPTF